MSQRNSEYERKPHDLYQTPAWVVGALTEHREIGACEIWEPACGEGQMAKALMMHGASHVYATDIEDHGYSPMAKQCSFLDIMPGQVSVNGIISNPPYGPRGTLAMAFVEHGVHHLTRGLALSPRPSVGFLALLLAVDFDSAKTRRHVFRDCPQFDAKIVLTKRIKWFEPTPGEKTSGPSVNHAWFIWESREERRHPPRLLYAPSDAAA